MPSTRSTRRRRGRADAVATFLHRFLARQFRQPSGLIGRFLVAPWLNRLSRQDNRLLIDELGVGPGDDVVELGIGGGDWIEMAIEAGAASVTAVDLSPAVVARASRRFAGERRVLVVEGRALHLPLAGESADRAASLHNIYFWDDVPAALAEFRRVLRPGGRLTIGFEPSAQMREWPGHEYGFTLFDAEDVEAAMRAAGFTRISSRHIEKTVDAAFVSGHAPARDGGDDKG